MTPSEVSAGVTFESAGSQWSRSWWRWIAYALTPFGCAMFPTPQFIRKQTGHHEEEDLLASLSVSPMCPRTPQERYRVAEDWLVGELGSPHSLGDRDLRTWQYQWGSVVLTYEMRDGNAEAYFLWEPLHSELLAEMRARIPL